MEAASNAMVRKLSRSLGAPVSSIVYIFKVDNRDLKSSICCLFAHVFRKSLLLVMMIAFITFKSSLVPLFEGLCSSNSWELELSLAREVK